MLHWLLVCIHCKNVLVTELDFQSFPLCSSCFFSLKLAPKLCSSCGFPNCPENECQREWRKLPFLNSYSALYLLNPSTYSLLKTWKKKGGWWFSRRILYSTKIEEWKAFEPQAVVSIPQNFERAWQKKGSRVAFLASWISRKLQIPHLPLLGLHKETKDQHQAQNNAWERDIRKNPFILLPSVLKRPPPQRILLVDDFLTTGKTIAQAGAVLARLGDSAYPRFQVQIHVFCLGTRRGDQFHLN